LEIVLIGGCGFIGRKVSSKLIQNNHRVISIHSRAHTPNKSEIECRLGNFGDVEFMAKILRQTDCLIHLGARYTPAEADRAPEQAKLADLEASKLLIETAISAQVPRIIFASSGGAIYGNLTQGTLAHEKMIPYPTSQYGKIKFELERTLLQACEVSSTKFQALRISNAYGPGQTARKNFGAIPTFLNQIEKNEPLTVLNSKSSRDYIFVDDVADAFLKTLEYKGMANVINIGTGIATTPIELIGHICKLIGKPFPLLNHSEELPNAVSFNALDCSLAANELAWMPNYNLKEGLRKVIAQGT
jgi:UDP-glucose 4-epimerase